MIAQQMIELNLILCTYLEPFHKLETFLSTFLYFQVYVWYVVYLTYKFIEEKKAAIAAGVYKEVAPAGPVTVAYRNLPEEPQVFYTQRYTTEPAIELASAAQSQHQRY